MLRIASLFVLVIGLSVGLAIYLVADDPVTDEMLLSKQYVGTIQRFGGRQAVLLEEFSQWMSSLWHGKRLGVTVACLGIFTAGALYFVARRNDHDK